MERKLPASFEIYKDRAGRFRWRLRSGNGEIIAIGEAYNSKASAKRGIEALKRYATSAAVEDLTAQVKPPANQVPTAAFTAQPREGEAPLRVRFDGSASSDPDGRIAAYLWDLGDGTTANSPTVDHIYSAAGFFMVRLTVTDDQAATGTTSQIVTVREPTVAVPAPPVDGTVATTLVSASSFLYSGAAPLQTGVVPGTIDPRRAAVVRGRVLTGDGQPLPGVVITVRDHPEFGQTATRTDGFFDMAVNGGGPVTLTYALAGHLRSERLVLVPWQDYARLPDAVLVLLDPHVSTVDLGAATSVHVVRGSQVSDGDGTRQATILFPVGTTADMVLPDGTTQALTNIGVRATEFTVGINGPRAMPRELPATSAYTYAVEFTVDEAVQAGARAVRFSQPLIHYVENFLDFPIGSKVPVGFYDSTRATWIPSDDGRIIRILSNDNGLAVLDVDGTGLSAAPASLAALGITDGERRQLAALYQPGQSLWRVFIPHFSPWDCNWPFGLPPDALSPNESEPESDDPLDDPCETSGSRIEVQNQILRESVKIVGTGLALHYSSDRVPGRLAAYVLEIPVSGGNLPGSLTAINLNVLLAGHSVELTFPPVPDLRHVFAWDGRDAYGRLLQGAQPVTVRIGYVYDAVYQEPAEQDASFAQFSGVQVTSNRARQEIVLWQERRRSLGSWDSVREGLGGWTLSVHHAYDPVGRVVHFGSGARRSSPQLNSVITTVAGTGIRGFTGDGGFATHAQLRTPDGIDVSPDGSIFIADRNNVCIRRVGQDGKITTVAGIGEQSGESGDGGPATQAKLSIPTDVAIGPDGSLYIADSVDAATSSRVRRVGPDGVITTVAGGGTGGDGGPAISAALGFVSGVAVGLDGSIYAATSGRVRRVGPDGVITTVAGGGTGGDGGPAVQAQIAPSDVAVGPDGSLYIAENNRVRRVSPDGLINTVAGTGTSGFSGDGGAAVAAQLDRVERVTVGPDGALYVADTGNARVRRVASDGLITTVAGSGPGGDIGDGGPAAAAVLSRPNGVAIGPDGSLFIADENDRRVRRVSPPLPGFGGDALVLSSEDGAQLYEFTNDGRHLRTVNTFTGAVMWRFEYDPDGRLSAFEGGVGNRTRIERDAAGAPAAIVAPFGQRTTLTLGTEGYLSNIANPAGDETALAYSSDGLLTSLTDPEGNKHRFIYDDLGRLIRDENPVGFTEFSRTDTPDGHQVRLVSSVLQESNFSIARIATGGTHRVNSCCGGRATEAEASPDGTHTITYPDGARIFLEGRPDPRFGMLASAVGTVRSTTPAGSVSTVSATRDIDLLDPDDPLSLSVFTDSLNINGRIFFTSFDAAQRQLLHRSPEGRERIAVVDGSGRVVAVRVNGSQPFEFIYDATGRLSRATRGGQAAEFTYDAQSRLSVFRDAHGNQFSYAYDDADRLIQATLPDMGVYQLSHDHNGNLIELTMPNGASHALSYSPLDLVSGHRLPGGQGYEATYDNAGRVTRITLPNGRTIDSIYDLDGRLTGREYLEASLDLTRDAIDGRVTSIRRISTIDGSAQQVGFSYDGPLLLEKRWSGPASGRYRYRYDASYQPVGITLDDRPEMVLTRDADGLLIEMGAFAIIHQGPAGATSGIRDGNLEITITHDDLGRVASRTHVVNGTLLYESRFTYDAGNRITAKQEVVAGTGISYAYRYDAAGQLLEAARDGVLFERYAYDPNGNRTSREVGTDPVQAAIYDIQDAVLQHGTVPVQVDEDGFVIQLGGDSFQYSARGELIRATPESESAIEYGYDGLGRRVTRVDSSGTYVYLYGNLQNPAEITAIRDPMGRLSIYHRDDSGLLFAIEREATIFYLATDQLGTPRALCDDAGRVIKTLDYDSYGGLISDSDPSFDLALGFAGGLTDPATGLTRFGWRDYSAALGRWMARDPIGLRGGPNLYRYAGNDPVNHADSSGWQVCYTDWCFQQKSKELNNLLENLVPDSAGVAMGADMVIPGFGGGGGSFGLNLQWTRDQGWALYAYGPDETDAFGYSVGGSCQVNVAWGSGEWTGLFENYSASYKWISGGYFQSPDFWSNDQPGYVGVSLGVGASPPKVGPPVSASYTVTNYVCLVGCE
jgi:RHS repeat-associated protein